MPTLALFNHVIEAGQKAKLRVPVAELPDGMPVQVPVVVVRGAKEGPTLCLSGVVHGDEYNGMAVISRLCRELDPQDLVGTVIGVPLMCPFAYFAETRLNIFDYELQNMNRIFPGDPESDLGPRIARTLFEGIFSRGDYLIDYHEGGRDFMARYLCVGGGRETPADVADQGMQLARWFGHGVPVLDLQRSADERRPGYGGTLDAAAGAIGIPSIAAELGGSGRLWEDFVSLGLSGTRNVMIGLGMLRGEMSQAGGEQPICSVGLFVRSNRAGLLVPIPDIDLGSIVQEGQPLALVYDAFGELVEEIRAPYRAVILDTRHSAVVYPGDWTYHCGKLP